MDVFLGCPEKVQVSFLIPIPITRYLLFTQHCVGRVKSNPECKHKRTSFNRIRHWLFHLEYSKLMFFDFFFSGNHFWNLTQYMNDSIDSFFFPLDVRKKKKEKDWHANCFKGNFIERLKLLFVWDLCLRRLSHGTNLQFFWKELTIEYHLYYWKMEKCSFIREVWCSIFTLIKYIEFVSE